MHTAYQDRRKHTRYQLEYKAEMVIGCGASVSQLHAIGRNASVSGLQLETMSPIPELTPVSFLLTFESGSLAHPVELRGEGIVVRVEAWSQGRYLVAIECKLPITQIQEHIPSGRLS